MPNSLTKKSKILRNKHSTIVHLQRTQRVVHSDLRISKLTNSTIPIKSLFAAPVDGLSTDQNASLILPQDVPTLLQSHHCCLGYTIFHHIANMKQCHHSTTYSAYKLRFENARVNHSTSLASSHLPLAPPLSHPCLQEHAHRRPTDAPFKS